MKILSHKTIVGNLKISEQDADSLVRKGFLMKNSIMLPPKISIPIYSNGFMNTMPVVIPELNVMGVKIVTRYPSRKPSIDGMIMLFDYTTGAPIALLNAFYITTLRTGAVAAMAMKTLAVNDYSRLSLVGMGNTGKAVISSILANYADRPLTISILEYKNRFSSFISNFPGNEKIKFVRCTSMQELVKNADAVFSCITNADGILAEPEWFKPGVTLIPVHTKGFQTCDLTFDRIFADDTGHVHHFKNFDKFPYFAEISNVLRGKDIGRRSDAERILSYNIGIAVHDVLFADNIVKRYKQFKKTRRNRIPTKL